MLSKETRGGYRAKAKRPLKFGNLETEKILILIPKDFKEVIKKQVNEILKKYEPAKI